MTRPDGSHQDRDGAHRWLIGPCRSAPFAQMTYNVCTKNAGLAKIPQLRPTEGEVEISDPPQRQPNTRSAYWPECAFSMDLWYNSSNVLVEEGRLPPGVCTASHAAH